MQSRYPKSFNLLTTNNQFTTDNPRLNHEALALLLLDTLKEKKDQTFVLAGSEDLRALLPLLKLHKDGDEVFILIRPYIDCMAIYLRRIADRTLCYVFDAQNWGLRYYPSRNILDALNHCLPDAEIMLSGTEVQSQKVQVGCVYYSLGLLDYCASHGETFIANQRSSHKNKLQNYNNVFQLPSESFPNDLLLLFHANHFIQTQHDKYLKLLEEVLGKNYFYNDSIDHLKIANVVENMQGYHLPPTVNSNTCLPFYDIQVNKDNNSITINLHNKDLMLYSNVLIFSNKLYPIQVSIDQSQILLNESKNIKVTLDRNNYRLTYQANHLHEIEEEFINLSKHRKVLFSQHLRQQLGLKHIANAVQEEIELANIKDKDGGFDQRQIQLALRYIFKNQHAVYVPRYSELSGNQVSLPLACLKEQGYQYVVFSWNVDATNKIRHQVAVCINLHTNPWCVSIYDSLANAPLNIDTRLVDLLSDYKHHYQLQNVRSKLPAQQHTWSCGVHAIAHCQLHVNPNLHDITQLKDGLDEEALARQYYRAYKYQENNESVSYEQAEANDYCKRRLLTLLENFNHTDLRQLTDFLQIEVWGNLLRNVSAHQCPNHSDEYRRTRPLSYTIAEYAHLLHADPKGKLLLEITHVFNDCNDNEFKDIILRAIKILSISNIIDLNKLNALTTLSLAISTDMLSFIQANEGLNTSDEQINFMKTLLCKLLSLDDPHKAIVNYVHAIDCEFYLENANFKAINTCEEIHFIIQQLLIRTMDNIVNRSEQHKSEYRRKKLEYIAKENQQLKKLNALKQKLADLIPTQAETFYLALSQHRNACAFIHTYINELFFSGLSAEDRIRYLENLYTMVPSINERTVLKIYPGDNILNYIANQFPPRTWSNFLEILTHLSPRHHFLFVIQHKDLINNGSHFDLARLKKLLHTVSKPVACDLARYLSQWVTNAYELHTILLELPKSMREEFAIENRSKIQGNSQLQYLRHSSTVHIHQFMNKVKAFAYRDDEILTILDLRIFLADQRISDRLQYAQGYVHLIKNNINDEEEVKQIFKLLNSVDKIALSLQLIPMLSIAELHLFRKAVLDLGHLSAFTYDWNAIQNCHELLIVLESLNNKDRLPLLLQYQQLINPDQIAKVLTLLDDDSLIAFCKYFHTMITPIIFNILRSNDLEYTHKINFASAILTINTDFHVLSTIFSAMLHHVPIHDLPQLLTQLKSLAKNKLITNVACLTQEQRTLLFAVFIDERLSTKKTKIILRHFDQIMSLLNQGSLITNDLITLKKPSATAFINLKNLLKSLDKFGKDALANLLSFGFSFNQLVNIEDSWTLYYLLHFSDLLEVHFGYPNAEEMRERLLTVKADELRKLLPAIDRQIIANNLSPFHTSETEVDPTILPSFITKARDFPNFTEWWNVFFNYYPGSKWLIYTNVLQLEHLSCLGKEKNLIRKQNLEHLLMSPQKFGRHALQYLLN